MNTRTLLAVERGAVMIDVFVIVARAPFHYEL